MCVCVSVHEREGACVSVFPCVRVHPPSSSQIGYCKHSPEVLHEDDSAGAEVGSD